MGRNMSRDIPIGDIRPNAGQPRKHFEGIEELAESLRASGQLVPVLVRPVGGSYELIHGERRWRAARLAGLATLRADVRDMSDSEALRLSVIENMQREQLTPIEEAEACRALLSDGMIQAEVGALIGKSQSYVAQKLRLLGLPEDVQERVQGGALTEGHARQILRVPDPEVQKSLGWGADRFGWTVAETRKVVDLVTLPLRALRGFTDFKLDRQPFLIDTTVDFAKSVMSEAELAEAREEIGDMHEQMERLQCVEAVIEIWERAEHWQNRLAENKLRCEREIGRLLNAEEAN